jgi:excisionase family DNA binding protein
MNDSLIPIADVAAATSMSRATIYRAVKAGTFPAPAKIGGMSRWSRQEIEAWIKRGLAAREKVAA